MVTSVLLALTIIRTECVVTQLIWLTCVNAHLTLVDVCKNFK